MNSFCMKIIASSIINLIVTSIGLWVVNSFWMISAGKKISWVFARIMKNKKSLANSLMIAYIWLKELNLIPSQIKTMTVGQFIKHLNLINDLYIVDNRDLFCLDYYKIIFCKIVWCAFYNLLMLSNVWLILFEGRRHEEQLCSFCIPIGCDWCFSERNGYIPNWINYFYFYHSLAVFLERVEKFIRIGCIFYKMVNGVIVAIRICELESLFEGMHSQQFEGVQKVVLKNLRKVQIEALMLYCERNCYL